MNNRIFWRYFLQNKSNVYQNNEYIDINNTYIIFQSKDLANKIKLAKIAIQSFAKVIQLKIKTMKKIIYQIINTYIVKWTDT